MASSPSSRFCRQLTSSLFLLNKTRRLIKVNNKISFISPFPPSSSISLLKTATSLRFYGSVGGSAAVVTADEDAALSPSNDSNPPPVAAHPWPEWDQFIEKMRIKGYFAKPSAKVAEALADSSYSASSMEVNRIKNACLAFARQRFDIFRSLPKEDIRAIVGCRCPNLNRKPVNSSKRLRAFLKLDEGDVCGACNLRGSCDKAYVTDKDDVNPRTVDVMRIIMTYAVDPALRSTGTNSSIEVHVQESARKLLGELIKLSDTTIDPTLLPKAEVKPPSIEQTSERSNKVTTKGWDSDRVERKSGDWICSHCRFLNFARNKRCLACKADGPVRVDFSKAEMKPGDWTCPQCEFLNYARNMQCLRCKVARPKRQLNPGEWECPRCDLVNFRRNTFCKKCERPRPAITNEVEDDEEFKFDNELGKPRLVTSKRAKLGRSVSTFRREEDEDDEELSFGDKFDDMPPLGDGKKSNFGGSKRATRGESRSTFKREQDEDDEELSFGDTFNDMPQLGDGKKKSFVGSKRATRGGSRSTFKREQDGSFL